MGGVFLLRLILRLLGLVCRLRLFLILLGLVRRLGLLLQTRSGPNTHSWGASSAIQVLLLIKIINKD